MESRSVEVNCEAHCSRSYTPLRLRVVVVSNRHGIYTQRLEPYLMEALMYKLYEAHTLKYLFNNQ